MITAIDTSVLLDVFGADQQYGPRSRDALVRCRNEGALVACDVVWAEVVAAFGDEQAARRALQLLGVDFDAIGEVAAMRAGSSWREYRQRGGTRTRVISDFLIAAHARSSADRLLTRDRGFTRTHFAGLAVLDPTAS